MGLHGLRLLSEEEEAAEAEDQPWTKSERTCDFCEEHFTYTDEIFVLEVSESVAENGEVFTDILRDEDDGDYRFRPYLMHFACWEETLETIREAVADMLPVPADEVVQLCSCCESEIAPNEAFVATQFGEIHISERSPNRLPTSTIARLGKMHPVCLLCLAHVIDSHFDEWEDLVELTPDLEDAEGEDDDE